MTKVKFKAIIMLLLAATSCVEQKQKDILRTEEISRTDLAQLELRDSSMLTHVKGPFYKSHSGQLFERTFAEREVDGADTLVSIEYFNGNLPQDLDPFTFEQLDGWFAKDKNAAYFYRPTSGGMLCVKLDSADIKTFRLLSGHGSYALDNKRVFKEVDILKNIDPNEMKITRSRDGKIVKIQSGETTYTAE